MQACNKFQLSSPARNFKYPSSNKESHIIYELFHSIPSEHTKTTTEINCNVTNTGGNPVIHCCQEHKYEHEHKRHRNEDIIKLYLYLIPLLLPPQSQ